MKSSELREKFLTFFEKHGHKRIPSASLIPDKTGSNQTTLFITAGMQPLIPFLLGQKHPEGKRIVDIQKCFRTIDIDEVGDDTHLTFFEMLGNWSLGDYWKKESIGWSFEFLTKELKIPTERLAVSCFAGDKDAPKDEESAKIWESLGIKKERITFLPKEDNWWGPVGETGPCGPDTEIFYWKSNGTAVPKKFEANDKNWVEIWNNVFMEYTKDSNGKYTLAEQKNVDTGMGFERTLAILNGYENVYETDLLRSIVAIIPDADTRIKRIIADHVRASVFLISDGVLPSNKDQGYVLRRLLRRAMTYAKINNFPKEGPADLLNVIIDAYKSQYPELEKNRQKILDVVYAERKKFGSTIENGLKEMEKMSTIDAVSAFYLYQTFGVPFDIIKEMGGEKAKNLNEKEFEEELKKHQDLSRTASAGMFKGGLADHSPETIKLHTAHHLLLAALQELFGKQVKQRGSNINQERLRIDFSFDRKLTDEEKKKVEDMVNEKIKEALDVVRKEMSKEEAEKTGAEMEFGVKYGNMVSVYFIAPMPEASRIRDGEAIGKDIMDKVFSKEFCGGPHVTNTSELGKFKILKEEASSTGVRRIKAILE